MVCSAEPSEDDEGAEYGGAIVHYDCSRGCSCSKWRGNMLDGLFV